MGAVTLYFVAVKFNFQKERKKKERNSARRINPITAAKNMDGDQNIGQLVTTDLSAGDSEAGYF